MTGDERNRRMEAARVRAELTVQDLWLCYVGLGGIGDAFELDGYLQALVPLETFQQDVLAQALNEGLRDLYEAWCVPLSTPTGVDDQDDRLARLVDELLDDREQGRDPEHQPPDDDIA